MGEGGGGKEDKLFDWIEIGGLSLTNKNLEKNKDKNLERNLICFFLSPLSLSLFLFVHPFLNLGNEQFEHFVLLIYI